MSENIVESKIEAKPPESENIIKLIFSGIRQYENKILMIDSASDRQWTGSCLKGAISNICNHLIKEYGLKKDDRCMIYGDNNDICAILITAVMACGGVATMLAQSYPGPILLDSIQELGSKYLFITPSLMKQVSASLKQVEDCVKTVFYDAGHEDSSEPLEIFLQPKQKSDLTFDEILAPTLNARPDDIAFIQFSSGTTGKPKPIPRTHANLCHIISTANHPELVDFSKQDLVVSGAVALGFRPGSWLYMSCLTYGRTIAFWNDPKWCPRSLLKCVEKYKVTIINCSLPLLSTIGCLDKKTVESYDVSSLKEIITSGAKLLNINLAKQVVSNLNLDSLRQSFGMTESGLVFLVEKSLANGNFLTVGHPTPGTQVKIVDRESGKALGANEKGEIMVKSKQIFPGYLVAGTDKLNRADFDEHDFFRIGDLGYFDNNQLFYIEGRFKEMMISKDNLRFSPTNIEMLLINHDAVADACVLKANTSDKDADYAYDIAKAYVILKPDFNASEKELQDNIFASSGVVVDGGIVFVQNFPRLPNGKVDKKALLHLTS